MATKIFVNLPVKDLARSMAFFKTLGFTFNAQFTDETAASMKISEDIYAMLLTHDKFKQFTGKAIADTASTIEVITCLGLDRKEAVGELLEKALAAGAKESAPAQDYGFMIARTFEDPDGHTWEAIWMDPSFVQEEQAA